MRVGSTSTCSKTGRRQVVAILHLVRARRQCTRPTTGRSQPVFPAGSRRASPRPTPQAFPSGSMPLAADKSWTQLEMSTFDGLSGSGAQSRLSGIRRSTPAFFWFSFDFAADHAFWMHRQEQLHDAQNGLSASRPGDMSAALGLPARHSSEGVGILRQGQKQEARLGVGFTLNFLLGGKLPVLECPAL
jgi:hypothetical protein